ncbi:hypothetical protein EJ063_04855 [Vibrio aquaticus]|uniref:GTP-binding protein n=1 Tax=Vibrio aquaticus TaxID=2496559 RepID=A0A3S0Q404_9VIBR|nr:hypothetical protein [Vibrio aquaticus]RTZ18120.1 hypothetical protein EJ063_04855 [Vibrio aquaticus]
MKWILAAYLIATTVGVHAEQIEHEPSFVTVNMTLEVDGIEQAIHDTRQSLDTIGSALGDIAESDSLSLEQQERLAETIENLNQVVTLSKESVAGLPEAFQQSKQILQTNSQQFLHDLKVQILVVVALIGVVIIAIIAAIFWFVLRPMQSTLVETTHNISSMAGAIKTTAQALEAISDQQQAISERLESVKQANNR